MIEGKKRLQGGIQGGTPGQFLAGGSVGGANGWRLALADVEPDGDLDVMQAVNNNQGARLWLNDGSGSFSQDSQALSPFSQAVVLADFDTDTDPDVMLGRSVNNKVWLNGEGTSNTPTPTSTPTNTPGPTATPPTPTPAGAKAWRRDIAAGTGGAGFNLALALGEHPYLAYAAIGNDILQLAVRVPDELQRGIIYNPYNPGDNGDNGNYIGDICVDIIDNESEQAIGGLDSWQPPVINTDYDIFAAMTDLFLRTPDGRRYTDLYLQHLEEVMAIGAADPLLLWDSYQTLQDFMPGLEALVTGRGASVVVTQRMVDNALAVWQRLAAAGSPALAQTINDGLADHNNLQVFVGMTFDEWARAIGVEPPGEKSVYLPVIIRE